MQKERCWLDRQERILFGCAEGLCSRRPGLAGQLGRRRARRQRRPAPQRDHSAPRHGSQWSAVMTEDTYALIKGEYDLHTRLAGTLSRRKRTKTWRGKTLSKRNARQNPNCDDRRPASIKVRDACCMHRLVPGPRKAIANDRGAEFIPATESSTKRIRCVIDQALQPNRK